ncbi:MAG: flagellar biosynthetic protein FliR [Actinomycetota bacterium]|nr:flagellar biosynthetic protein FliR [Actinomycetota bacterium]
MNALLRQFSEQEVAGFMLVLGRVAPLFLLAPLFSARMFPARARGIAAVALAVGLAPLVLREGRVPLDALGLGGLMVKEILVGLAFAFAVGAVISAVAVAGSFLDTLIGFSYGALVDPLTGNQNAVLSQMYALLGMMVFIGIGGDALVVQGLARTYELVPLVALPALGALTAGVRDAFVGIFTSALQLAAPVILALVLTDAAFGVAARVVPQLNVFAVGFPAKIVVGLALIAATLPFAGGFIADSLQHSLDGALGGLRVR